MALSILDGNQSATTLSTILSSGQHITAHTVVSLGTQAITDIVNATSAGLTNTQLRASAVTIGGTVTATGFDSANGLAKTIPVIKCDDGIANNSDAVPVAIAIESGSINSSNPLPISGTVTVGALPSGVNFGSQLAEGYDNYGGAPVQIVGSNVTLPISGTVTIGSLPSLVAGTAQIGSVTVGNPVTVGAIVGPLGGSVFKGSSPSSDSIRVLPYFSQNGASNYFELSTSNPFPIAGTVTLGVGTAQIGSVTASISGTVPISISSVTVGNSVTIGSLPAISGTVTANLAISSSAITSGSFTSLTSATLVPANTARKMATVYNLGAGQLFINAGASATTLGGGFMVALSSGDFFECDYTTTTLSAVFATAGTASWVSH
jgi:hypothetical protein